MDTDRLKLYRWTQHSWFALSLLAGEYALLGWYLSAHHVFWLISFLIIATTILITWKSSPVFELLSRFFHQPLLVVFGICLLISSTIALTFIQPLFLSLMLLPLVTLLYALLELKVLELHQTDAFLSLVTITSLGLAIGEAIDIFIFPSLRY